MLRRAAPIWVLAAAACCSKSEVKGGGSGDPPPAKPTFTVFAFAEVRGQIAPCGCTSDPLGDISRTSKLVADARAAGPVLFVDAGSLLYSKWPVPPAMAPQEQLKADLLAHIYKDELHAAAVGLGPADLADGPTKLRLPREAANVSTATTPPVEAPRVVEVGGAKVGVFGAIAQGAVHGIDVTDPVPAGKTAVGELRKQGAQVVIALVQAGNKSDAARLVHDIGGIDLAVAGLGINAPEPPFVSVEPDKIGDAWLVIPGNRGQILSRVDVTLRGDGPLVDAVGAAAAAEKAAAIDRQIASIDADLAKFAKDKDADPKFIAAKKEERTRLVGERDHLKAQPLVAPAKGSYFTLEQIRISKALACSAPVQKAVLDYDRAAGEANVKAAGDRPVTPAAKGEASYVGMDTCSDCHQDEADFWKTTVHAKAWQTLVERGQQFDYECIGCHVTGFDKPGGSNLAHNDKLRDVQCETCHGPGSIHVAKGGKEKPAAIRLAPPDDLCASQCHTKEHSDTFQLEPYLRDIVGKGHGEKARAKLGNGPTGHELRGAALEKAGKAIGAGCVR